MLDDGTDAPTTARREAMEEAGLRLGELELVAYAWPSPGMLTERLSLFLAPYRAADRVGAGGGVAEEHEEIEVVEMPLGELAALVDRGEIYDMKTLILVQTLRLRRPDLFETAT
jgi:nudix-type nucleoside diphosphatase (YffH/AdpP family)